MKAQSQAVKDSLGIKLLEVQTKLGGKSGGGGEFKQTPLIDAMRLGSNEAAAAIQRTSGTNDSKIAKATQESAKSLKVIEKMAKSNTKTTQKAIHFVT